MELGEEEEEEEDNELVVLDPSHVQHKCFYTSVLHYSDLRCSVYFFNTEDESESASHWDNILNFVTVVVQ